MRILAGGNGTYDTILSNLKKLINLQRNIRAIIRVNYDDFTFHSIPKFLHEFPESFRERVEIYFGKIHSSYVPLTQTDGINCTKSPEAVKESIELCNMAMKEGFTISPWFESTFFHCCPAEFENYFVIAPDGSFHRCTVAFEAEKLGKLVEGGKIKLLNVNLARRWLLKDIFEDPECRECKLLPLCWGGCQWARMTGNTEFCLKKSGLITNILQYTYQETLRKNRRIKSFWSFREETV